MISKDPTTNSIRFYWASEILRLVGNGYSAREASRILYVKGDYLRRIMETIRPALDDPDWKIPDARPEWKEESVRD